MISVCCGISLVVVYRNYIFIGHDTDLLVLVYYNTEINAHNTVFKPEPNQRSKIWKVWNIRKSIRWLNVFV